MPAYCECSTNVHLCEVEIWELSVLHTHIDISLCMASVRTTTVGMGIIGI